MRLYFLIVCLCAVFSAQAEVIHGRVIRVIDGDTLTVLDAQNQQHKIRLAEIDAPEIGHGKKKLGQPYGRSSKETLAFLCAQITARVDVIGIDQYKRKVGRVVCGGQDANLFLVAHGMAWAYERYNHRPAIAQAEKDARKAHLGLWIDAQPTPPWEWRKRWERQRGMCIRV